MSSIAVPRSVRDYMHRRAVRKAIDLLLETGTEELPEGLDEWSEVRAYHRAYLSACQVRGEHALLLMDVWDAVWGTSLASGTVPWKPLSPDEQFEDGEGFLTSPDDLWTNGDAFCRTFVRNEAEYLTMGVDYWHDVGIRLYVMLYDEERDAYPSEDILLPAPWSKSADEDGFRNTANQFHVPDDLETTDVARLQAAAIVALRAFP